MDFKSQTHVKGGTIKVSTMNLYQLTAWVGHLGISQLGVWEGGCGHCRAGVSSLPSASLRSGPKAFDEQRGCELR